MIIEIILCWSEILVSKTFVFIKTRFDICEQKIDKTWICWILKINWNESKNRLRIGLLVHCVKTVQIRSYFCPYFSVFGLYTFSMSTGKYGPKITPCLDTFHAVVVMLKSTIRINFSYLFDNLLIIVSGLVVKWVSLRLGGLYIPATRILFLRIVISIVRISMSEGFSILYLSWQLISNIKINSSPKFVSISSYKLIIRHNKLIAWKELI